MNIEEKLAQTQQWYPKRNFVIKGETVLEVRHCPDCDSDWLARDLGEGFGGSVERCPDCAAVRRAKYEAEIARGIKDNRRKIEAAEATERWCD